MKGRFISLEGGEGAGKSSALTVIKAWLESQSIPYILTREPGGTPMAEEIREIVLKARSESVAKETELLLVFAARVQHLFNTIRPALEAGKWVISDRFVDSSYVYQGVARGIDKEKIDSLVAQFLPGMLPDKTILLDVPVSIGLSRVAQRGDSNRLDAESMAFHQMVRDGFLAQAETYPKRFSVIDAAQSIKQVELDIISVMASLNTTSLDAGGRV